MIDGPQGPQPNKNPLEVIQNEISNARALIDSEFNRGTSNSWLACFVTRLSVLIGNTEFAKEDGLISKDQAVEMDSKLKVILQRQRALAEEYRGQRDISEELKEELITSLDILK